jgi:hypothetical protein
MKTILTLLFILIIHLYPGQARAGNPDWQSKIKVPSLKGYMNKDFQFGYTAPPKREIANSEARYKTQQTLGFTLVPLGAAAVAGGAYMIYKGTSKASTIKIGSENLVPKKEEKKNDLMLMSTGAALAFLGLAVTSGGLVLGITGTVRRNKFNQSTHGVYIKTSTKRISVTYRF